MSNSMIVARMQKMSAGNLTGSQKHNQREYENHSNEDIEKDRSELNYDLVNDEKINYRERVTEIIDSQRESTRAIRKDAVLVNEWIITSNQEFFKDFDEQETKRFFETSLEYFSEKFGSQNMAFAQVHLDETTPHMHLGIVPMTEDGRLSGKTVFNRNTLKEIQDNLPKYLQEKGFDIERGIEGTERKHISKQTYSKIVKETEKEVQEKIEELVKEVKLSARPKQELDELKKETFKTPKIGSNKYVLTPEQFKKVEGLAMAGIKRQLNVRDELKENKKEIADLKAEKQKISNYSEGLIEEMAEKSMAISELEKENFVLESRLVDSRFPKKAISDLEYQGRKIIDRLEKGEQPETKEVAEDWKKTLEENRQKGLISPSRLGKFIEKLKEYISRFVEKAMPNFGMDQIKRNSEKIKANDRSKPNKGHSRVDDMER